MPRVVADLIHLPMGSHCIAFYASQDEGAETAAEFLAGTPEGQAAAFWVADTALQSYYRDRVEEISPRHVGCVLVLDGEQVESDEGKLRPVDEVRTFVASHPDGVTGGADTISRYWTPGTFPEHVEYEAWFDAQPRDGSRFLCPYDLRRVPASEAPGLLRELGRHHSHASLSSSPEPAVRLLQLFVFPRA